MSGTAADVIRIARAELGYQEGRSGGRWNNIQRYSPAVPGLEWSQGQPWCQTYQAYVFRQAGAAALAPVTASCAAAVRWFRDRGRFSEYPAVGAQVFFGPGGGSHVGLVYAYDRNYAYTVEGNTNATGSAEGDGVYLKKRARRDDYLYGYGYPAYPGGIVSADPGWARPVPPPAVRSVSLRALINSARADPPRAGNATSNFADVVIVEQALVAEGLLAAARADGHYGTDTIRAYAAWQRRCNFTGDDADGIPGHSSLTDLGEAHGFEVTP
ncbi:CHAP domain-containing protein [Streptomycetaceae bacterium NBC_01309]